MNDSGHHEITRLRQGWKTGDCTICGLVEVERIPTRPWEHIIVCVNDPGLPRLRLLRRKEGRARRSRRDRLRYRRAGFVCR